MDYHIIGDIHGHAAQLEQLFRKLGYAEQGGHFTPPDGVTTVFIGDLIDRGPDDRRVVEIVRSLVERGRAHCLMGNHEFNALAYHTPWPQGQAPAGSDGWLRPHTGKNRKQHASFLVDHPEGSPAAAEALDFFRTLPLLLELPDVNLRLVHACWSRSCVAELRRHPQVRDHRISPAFLADAVRPGTREHHLVETLIKGPECAVPLRMNFSDADQNSRSTARYRWWGSEPADDPARLLLLNGVRVHLGSITPPIDPGDLPGPDEPVMVGHYWWSRRSMGDPVVGNFCCIDLSVARHGNLGCYVRRAEHAGEALHSRHIVAV